MFGPLLYYSFLFLALSLAPFLFSSLSSLLSPSFSFLPIHSYLSSHSPAFLSPSLLPFLSRSSTSFLWTFQPVLLLLITILLTASLIQFSPLPLSSLHPPPPSFISTFYPFFPSLSPSPFLRPFSPICLSHLLFILPQLPINYFPFSLFFQLPFSFFLILFYQPFHNLSPVPSNRYNPLLSISTSSFSLSLLPLPFGLSSVPMYSLSFLYPLPHFPYIFVPFLFGLSSLLMYFFFLLSALIRSTRYMKESRSPSL